MIDEVNPWLDRRKANNGWLEHTGGIAGFVVLDDRWCEGYDTIRTHVLQPDPEVGLTEEECFSLEKMLHSQSSIQRE